MFSVSPYKYFVVDSMTFKWKVYKSKILVHRVVRNSEIMKGSTYLRYYVHRVVLG